MHWVYSGSLILIHCLSHAITYPCCHHLGHKVGVLRESSKVFEPLGLLSSVTIKAKEERFMQKLWHCIVEWDEPLTEDDQKQWMDIAHDIQEATSVSISRHCLPKDN